MRQFFEDHDLVAFVEIGQDRALDPALITNGAVFGSRSHESVSPFISEIYVLRLFFERVCHVCIFSNEIHAQVERGGRLVTKENDLFVGGFRSGIAGESTVDHRVGGRVDRNLEGLQRSREDHIIKRLIPVEALIQGTAHQFIRDVQRAVLSNECPLLKVLVLEDDRCFILRHLSEVFPVGHPPAGRRISADQVYGRDGQGRDDQKQQYLFSCTARCPAGFILPLILRILLRILFRIRRVLNLSHGIGILRSCSFWSCSFRIRSLGILSFWLYVFRSLSLRIFCLRGLFKILVVDLGSGGNECSAFFFALCSKLGYRPVRFGDGFFQLLLAQRIGDHIVCHEQSICILTVIIILHIRHILSGSYVSVFQP